MIDIKLMIEIALILYVFVTFLIMLDSFWNYGKNFRKVIFTMFGEGSYKEEIIVIKDK